MIAIDLTDRVAIVTGASAGIGRATCTVLTEAGARVIAIARREVALCELASQAPSGSIVPVAVDLTRRDAAAHIVREVRATMGRLDILVNAAGGSRTVSVDAEDAVWDEAMDLNFNAGRRLTQAVLTLICDSGHGRVITVSGSSEPASNPLFANPSRASALNASNSAKAAVHAWSKGLSREVGRAAVTVNCVAPGSVLTEQIEKIFPTEVDRARHVADLDIPAGRFGSPREVAQAVAFLASDLARYITGEIIHVDGGKRRFAF